MVQLHAFSVYLKRFKNCHFLYKKYSITSQYYNRVAGNAAYVLGTLAESDLGCYRVISLTNSKHPDSDRIMRDLSDMLLCEDAESVMNAAGTMGTLVSTSVVEHGPAWHVHESASNLSNRKSIVIYAFICLSLLKFNR